MTVRAQTDSTAGVTHPDLPAPAVDLAAPVEAQAQARPDAPAVVCGDRSWTYRDLNAHANRLAHALIARGVGPDVCVGVCAGRSFGAVAAVLAVLKAGGAYVPLDPAYPRGRLA